MPPSEKSTESLASSSAFPDASPRADRVTLSWSAIPKLLSDTIERPQRHLPAMDLAVAVALPLMLTLCTFQNNARLGRLIGGALFVGIVAWQWRKGLLSSAPLRALALPLLSVVAATGLSVAMSMDVAYSLKTFFNQHLWFPLLMVATALWAVTPKRQMIFLRSLMIAGAISALFGIFLYYFAQRLDEAGMIEKWKDFVYRARDEDHQVYYRARGMLESYTRSAVVFIFALPATLAIGMIALREKDYRGLAIALVVAVLSVWYLLLTKTRGAWICTAGACLLTFILLRGKAWVAAGIMAVPLLVLLALPTERNRAMTLIHDLRKPDLLLSGRISLWNQASEALLAHKWTGVGYGQDIFQQPAVRKAYPLETDRKQPDLHQMYLQTLAEVGLIGLTAYAFLIGTLLVLGASEWWRGALGDHPGAAVGLASLLGMLTAGFVYAYNENQLAIILWTTAGLLAAPLGRLKTPAAA